MVKISPVIKSAIPRYCAISGCQNAEVLNVNAVIIIGIAL